MSLAWPRERASRPGTAESDRLQSARCGPTDGMAARQITVPTHQESVRQRQLLPSPARLVLQRPDPSPGSQICEQCYVVGLQRLEIGLSMHRQRLTSASQLRVPGIQLRAAGPGLQQGIALPERPRVAAPQGQELGFHVEQTPVQVAPPGFPATADQYVAARVEADHRQGGTQLAQVRDWRPVQAPAPFLAAMAKSRLAPSGPVAPPRPPMRESVPPIPRTLPVLAAPARIRPSRTRPRKLRP